MLNLCYLKVITHTHYTNTLIDNNTYKASAENKHITHS